MGESGRRTGDSGERQTLRKGEGSELWEFSPLWLCCPKGSEGNLNAPYWLQLMAGFSLASSLCPPAGWGSGLVGAGHVLVGQDKRPEACLPPAHLALRTHSISGPHPGPGLIPGWQQPREQKVYLSAPTAPPFPSLSPGPLSGAPLAARTWALRCHGTGRR